MDANNIALLWQIDKGQPLDQAIKDALHRYRRRPELAGRIPQIIQFPKGRIPAQLPLIDLAIEEAGHVPAGCFKLV